MNFVFAQNKFLRVTGPLLQPGWVAAGVQLLEPALKFLDILAQGNI